MNLNFQYANNPSRLNPRMPNAGKKNGNLDEAESAFSHIFNDSSKPPNLSLLAENLGESASLSSSLMFADQNRTPMVDLIQVNIATWTLFLLLIKIDIFTGGFSSNSIIYLF